MDGTEGRQGDLMGMNHQEAISPTQANLQKKMIL